MRYLLDKTEQLSLENGALKMQLVDQDPPASIHHVHKAAAAGATKAGRSSHRHDLQQHSSPCSRNSKGAGNPRCCRIAAAAGTDDGSDDEGGRSSIVTGSDSLADRDDISAAANEELAAAQAAAAAECARRRRQRTAAAAAAGHGSADCYSMQHSSPSRHALSLLHRSSSLDSLGTAESDNSSCSTLSPGPAKRPLAAAANGRSSRGAGGNARDSSSPGLQASGGSKSRGRQLLETVLANYPNKRLGHLMQELVAAAGTAGTSTAALAAAGSSAFRAGGGGEREQFGSRRGSSAIGAANAALSREQLRRLAELSPGRQRLLRALAAANTK